MPIWLGEHDHQNSYAGDHGVRFKAATSADFAIYQKQADAIWEMRERARARGRAERCGDVLPHSVANLPKVIEADLYLLPSSGERLFAVIRTGDMVQCQLVGAWVPIQARARAESVERGEIGPGGIGRIRLAPVVPEFWESLDIGAQIELCDGDVTIGRATVAQVVRREAVVDIAANGAMSHQR